MKRDCLFVRFPVAKPTKQPGGLPANANPADSAKKA
jgi:hypothetical protein